MPDDIVGEVSVRVRPDLTEFNADLQRKLDVVAKSTVGTSNTINKALGNLGGGGSGALAGVNRGLAAATANSQALGRSVDNNAMSFASAAATAAGFTAAVYGVKRAAEGAIGKLAGLFDQLAQARAGFTSILKSETAAENLLADIREFARLSPFVTQELVNYSQQLLGVGQSAETIVPLLRSVGDIVASVGGDQGSIGRVLFTLTQIRTIGRLIGQDARQLQSALIPITQYLASYLGKTTEEIKKMQEAGSITADTVFAALTAAGDKVEGAMDRATRNIKGAKAILGDTVTIMFQNQPVMQRLFEDTYKGILRLSDALGSDEFQTAFNNFFEGVEKVYEGVRPLVAEMAKIGGQGVLIGLQTAATIFKVFAQVLDSFPEPVLTAVARALAAMALLKAPTMLLRYISSIKMLTMGLVGGGLTTGLKSFNTGMMTTARTAGYASASNYAVAASLKAVGNQALITKAQYEMMYASYAGAASQGRFSRFKGPAMSAAVIAAAIGGQLLQSQGTDNVGSQAGGGALTYGALGMMAGPLGAVVGAGLGGVIGFIGAAEAKARKHVEAMRELGRLAAEGFIRNNAVTFQTATAKSASLLEDELSRLQSQLTEIEVLKQRLSDPRNFEDPRDSIAPWLLFAFDDPTLDSEFSTLKAKYEEMFGPVREAITNTLTGFEDPEMRNAFLEQFFDGTMAGNQIKSFQELQSAAHMYGTSLEAIGADGGEALARIFSTMHSVADATKEALLAAGKFNGEFEKAKVIFEESFGARSKQIATELSVYDAQEKAAQALAASYREQGNEILKLQAEQAVYTAAVVVGAKARADAVARGVHDEVRLAAEGLAAAEAYLASARVQTVATINELTNTYGIAKERLIEVLNLSKELDPNIKLVITADTADALAELTRLLALQQALLNPTGGITGTADAIERNQRTTADRIQDIIEKLQGVSAPILDQAKSGGGGGGSQSPLVSAMDGLTKAVEDSKSATVSLTEALMTSIRDRSQYERAISIGTLTKNASRQASDIAEIGVLTSAVLSRGLSESALKSVIGSLGIEDLKQLRRLNSASGTDLLNLSAAVDLRDAAAVRTATERSREEQKIVMVEAIVAAAKILGYKVDKAAAAQILAEFNITSATDAEKVADAILGKLSGALIST